MSVEMAGISPVRQELSAVERTNYLKAQMLPCDEHP
jgi:hypothetical protein